ncbi:hypothetical protein DRH14_02175 [Candidatus Shapirobacteria bacterium]|nr:MAG: hypothetical protein DRH14_02175 [Candidatus Shapirobacteria bacterium]
MFPTTIISNFSQLENLLKKLQHKLDINNPDILIIDKQTGWSIDQVRKIRKFSQSRALKHSHKIVIIKQAHQLRNDAQNALLKNLEEPPEYLYFILISSKPYALIPTILSRAHLQLENNQTKTEETKILNFDIPPKQLLLQSDQLAQLDNLPAFLEQQIKIYQQQLLKQADRHHTQIIKQLFLTIKMLKQNVKAKFALDYLFLSLS